MDVSRLRWAGRPIMAHLARLQTSHGPRASNRILVRTKSQLRRARLVADGGGLENR